MKKFDQNSRYDFPIIENWTHQNSKVLDLGCGDGSLLNYLNLSKFKKRLDPRLYNGAIFIGLDSPVIKSHGGTDYIGFSNSLSVCTRIVSGNLIEKIRNNIS